MSVTDFEMEIFITELITKDIQKRKHKNAGLIKNG